MTTTPAMPEGVTLEDLMIPLRAALDTCHDTDWTLSQFKTHITHALAALATLQAQPAAAGVSDDDIYKLWVRHCETTEMTTRQIVCGFARAILALRPQAVPMTDEPKAAPKLIGWRTENFLWETDDVDKARNWEPNIGVLPIFEGDPNTKLGSHGITATAGGEKQA